jgi:hypothetical protein
VTASGADGATPQRRRASSPGARGVLCGIILGVAFVLLGPDLGARVQLGAGILALAMGIAINVAASTPASRRWSAPLQGALRRTALFSGPVFCAAGAALALAAAGTSAGSPAVWQAPRSGRPPPSALCGCSARRTRPLAGPPGRRADSPRL